MALSLLFERVIVIKAWTGFYSYQYLGKQNDCETIYYFYALIITTKIFELKNNNVLIREEYIQEKIAK